MDPTPRILLLEDNPADATFIEYEIVREMEKLNIHDIAGLVRYAMSAGLIKPAA